MDYKYIKNERELRYFGFVSNQFCEDFCEMTEEIIIKENLNELEKAIINKLKNDESPIKGDMEQLYHLYMEKIRGPLKRLQVIAEELFSLPPNALLEGYEEDEVEKVSHEQIKKIEKNIEDLEKQYLEERCFNIILKKEKEKYQPIKPLYEKVQQVINSIKKDVNEDDKSIRGLFSAVKLYHHRLFHEENNPTNFFSRYEINFKRM